MNKIITLILTCLIFTQNTQCMENTNESNKNKSNIERDMNLDAIDIPQAPIPRRIPQPIRRIHMPHPPIPQSHSLARVFTLNNIESCDEKESINTERK